VVKILIQARALMSKVATKNQAALLATARTI